MNKSMIAILAMSVSFGAAALSVGDTNTVGVTTVNTTGYVKGVENKYSVVESENSLNLGPILGNTSVETYDETSNKIKYQGSINGSSTTSFNTFEQDGAGGADYTYTTSQTSGVSRSNINYTDKYSASGSTDKTFSNWVGSETEHSSYNDSGKVKTNVKVVTETDSDSWSVEW